MTSSLYKIIHIALLFGVFGLPLSALAQNEIIKTEFKALSLYYSEVEAFSVDINVKYLSVNGSVLTEQSGSVCKTKDFHFIHMAGVTNLLCKGEHIVVSEGSQTILYSTYEEEILEQIHSNKDISAMLDSLWLKQEHLTYKILEQNDNILKVQINDLGSTMYDFFNIVIDTKLHHILALNYYLDSKENNNSTVGQINVSYSNETDKPKQNLEKYKVKYYVQAAKNSTVLAEKYKNYQLIDQSKN